MDWKQLASWALLILEQATWGNLFLSVAAGFLIYLLWRLNKRDARFDVADLFLDPKTGKASGSQLIVLSMAGLSAWTVVSLVSRNLPVTELLLGVLAIFVAGKTVKEVWGTAQDVSTSTTITTQSAAVTPPTPLPVVPPPDAGV